MKKKSMTGNVMLLSASLIWGLAFVAQAQGMDYIGPYTFNACRFLLAAAALVPMRLLLPQLGAAAPGQSVSMRATATGGLLCGIILLVSGSLQQVAMLYTTVGKTGFITTLYIVFVPVFGWLLFRTHISPACWAAVFLALAGLYLIGMPAGGASINRGDLLALAGGFGYTFHILVVDRYSPRADGVLFCCIQFAVAGLGSLVPMLLTEQPRWDGILAAAGPLLYVGICSSAIAFTLQILGQRYTQPAVASLLLSFESVFAALGGWLILKEKMSVRELTGCGLMFCAVLLTQAPMPGRRRCPAAQKK